MHIIIVGATFSGKSKLAKMIAKQKAQAGHKVMVFDPLKTSGWPESAKLYAKPSAFVAAYWEAENVYVFIDEAKVLFDKEPHEAERIAYQGRHGGRLNFFIGQRAMSMIPPNARNQCPRVYAFKQSVTDSDTLAKEYDERLNECPKLGKLEFLMSDGFSAAKGKLKFESATADLPTKIEVMK